MRKNWTQGRYKAILIDTDSYLLELSRYVHLNPVRLRPHQGKAVGERIKYLERYKWSSLTGYINASKKQFWVTYEAVLSYVGGGRKRYAVFMTEGLRKGYGTPWEELKGQAVLGEEEFVEEVKGRIKEPGSTRERPGVRQLEAKDPARLLSEVAQYFGVAESQLVGKRTGYRDQRGVALELMYRHGGVSQAEIGKLVGGLDYTAVSRERRRVRERIAKDNHLGRAIEKIRRLILS